VRDIAAEIEADREESERTDDTRRLARLSGLRCSCCDEPLPAEHAEPECADCAQL
jgi:hypothetical protein